MQTVRLVSSRLLKIVECVGYVKHAQFIKRVTNSSMYFVRACLFLKNQFGFLMFFLSKKQKIKKQTNRGPPRVSGVREQCNKLTKIGF